MKTKDKTIRWPLNTFALSHCNEKALDLPEKDKKMKKQMINKKYK